MRESQTTYTYHPETRTPISPGLLELYEKCVGNISCAVFASGRQKLATEYRKACPL